MRAPSPMLYLRRTVGIPGTPLRRDVHTVRGADVRVYVCALAGLSFDAGVLTPMTAGFVGRSVQTRPHSHFTLVLEGAQIVRTAPGLVEVSAGTALVERALAWDERWEGARYRSLTIEWPNELGAIPQRSVWRASAGLVEVARELADALASGALRGAAARAAVLALAARLRAEGVPLEGLDARALEVDPHVSQELADAWSWLESSLDQQPMWVDFERRLGLGERQLRRRFAQARRLLDVASDSLRAHLLRRRALAAATLVTARDVPIRQIARALGYSCDRALARALDQLGLPPPSELRTRVLTGHVVAAPVTADARGGAPTIAR